LRELEEKSQVVYFRPSVAPTVSSAPPLPDLSDPDLSDPNFVLPEAAKSETRAEEDTMR
jgi:hypothetical protein